MLIMSYFLNRDQIFYQDYEEYNKKMQIQSQIIANDRYLPIKG